MSKTIKMIARRKNRRENGRRAEWFGSKPHSNGDNFSRSMEERIDVSRTIKIIMDGISMEIIKVIDMSNICPQRFMFFL